MCASVKRVQGNAALELHCGTTQRSIALTWILVRIIPLCGRKPAAASDQGKWSRHTAQVKDGLVNPAPATALISCEKEPQHPRSFSEQSKIIF